MKKKFKTLTSLVYDGCYLATWFDEKTGCFEHISFMLYNKKDVIYLLRNKYDVIVSRDFC